MSETTILLANALEIKLKSVLEIKGLQQDTRLDFVCFQKSFYKGSINMLCHFGVVFQTRCQCSK